MKNFCDYYEILDVSPDATVDEIKRAYRRLARKYHPDVNPGDQKAEETFKNLVEAYDVLCDPEKRQQYDNRNQKKRRRGKAATGNQRSNGKQDKRYGEEVKNFVEQTIRGPRRESNNRTQTSYRVPKNDSNPYRPGTKKTAYKASEQAAAEAEQERPRDVEARLKLPLEKAYKGGNERIRLEDGRSLEIDMPSGMIDGQQMRLRGQGIAGGDLYLTINIASHYFFKLQGKDVFCRVPVTPSEAVLGSAITVRTLDGLVQMSVPAGVKSGQRLRLANKGYPVEGERGDQLVEIQIVVPSEPSDEEKQLYQKLREVETWNPRESIFQYGGKENQST